VAKHRLRQGIANPPPKGSGKQRRRCKTLAFGQKTTAAAGGRRKKASDGRKTHDACLNILEKRDPEYTAEGA